MPSKTRIPKSLLLIDKSESLRNSIAEQLDLQGEFQTISVGTGFSGLETAKENSFDAIVVSIDLPDIDGRQLCHELRFSNLHAFMVAVVESKDEIDLTTETISEADDFLIKPFKISTLVSMLRSHFLQRKRIENSSIVIGKYTFRPNARLLIDSNTSKQVRLTDKETSIIKFLFDAGDCVVNRETLLSEVWGYNSAVTTHTLETHVYRLRQKMESDPSAAEILVTEEGGYRLVII